MKISPFLSLIPIATNLVFLLLYGFAASVYVNKSIDNETNLGFSLLNNYWCDLFSMGSPSRPIALFALSLVCFGLCFFWYILPFLLPQMQDRRITYFGISAMIVLLFLPTSYHDAVINIGGALASVALTLFFWELYKHQYNTILGFGLFLLFLGVVNYFIYQTRYGVQGLPLLQKLTFLYALWWISWVSFQVYRKL